MAFSVFHKYRSEVAGDVISGMAVESVSMGVRATVAELFDSLAGRTRFMHFCTAYNGILKPTEKSSSFVYPASL